MTASWADSTPLRINRKFGTTHATMQQGLPNNACENFSRQRNRRLIHDSIITCLTGVDGSHLGHDNYSRSLLFPTFYPVNFLLNSGEPLRYKRNIRPWMVDHSPLLRHLSMEWIEQVADSFVWFVPVLAALGLWTVRWNSSKIGRVWAERLFFAALLVVASGTLRTIVVDDPSWLLHTFSLGAMVVGATFPNAPTQSEHFEF